MQEDIDAERARGEVAKAFDPFLQPRGWIASERDHAEPTSIAHRRGQFKACYFGTHWSAQNGQFDVK